MTKATTNGRGLCLSQTSKEDVIVRPSQDFLVAYFTCDMNLSREEAEAEASKLILLQTLRIKTIGARTKQLFQGEKAVQVIRVPAGKDVVELSPV